MKYTIFILAMLVAFSADAQKKTTKKATTKTVAARKDTTSQPFLSRAAARPAAGKATLTALDVINVASLTLQAQDWAWLVGDAPVNADSVAATNFRKIRDKIRLDNPAAWSTNVTVSNLSASVVMYFYRKAKTASAGEIAGRYSAITTAIAGVGSLATYVTEVDSTLQADFNRRRDAGRVAIMDN